MPIEPGRQVGPYEVISVLGSGGMGTVYLARDTRLDRRVALKFVCRDSSGAGGEGASRRILHEARAASALSHPNICHIYDVGGEGAEAWIAMEYIEGEPLSKVVASKGRLAPDDATRLGIQIADALEHAHGRGILHRDLKSANIVRDRSGRPKILDFGIAGRVPAQQTQEITRTDTGFDSQKLTGTLAYMAPEVIRGEATTERSDLWSLGVVLYEMLAGALPFRGRNMFDLTHEIVQGPAPRMPAHVPEPLARIVQRLLSKDPGERYANASAVAAALQVVGEAQRAPVLPAAPIRKVRLVLPILGLAALAAFAVWRFERDRPLRLGEQRLVPADQAALRAPSYSPDASMLAYVAPDAQGIQQIWVRKLEQGVSIQATHGEVNASRPRWMGKSDRIIYAQAGRGIWIVSPLGGTPTRLIAQGTNPNVSADGNRLVFERERAIWTAGIDGSDVRPVPGVPRVPFSIPLSPALSPDGTTIAYFRAELGPNGDFWTIPWEGGTPRRLTSDLREGGDPVWTRDGSTIVFGSARAGSRTLWQIPARGGEPVPLTTGAGEDDQPDISPDGSQIAYTNVRNTWELQVRSIDGSSERTLFQRGVQVLFPMFSPDGQRITYFGRADYAVAIFTIGVDGSDLRQLTGGRELNHQPRWGADGKDVYFFQHYPTVSLRRVSALGGPSEAVRSWTWHENSTPYFDPSGRYIAYLRQRPIEAPPTVPEHTVIHEVATGQERIWPEPHTHIGGWSPDGASIVGWQHEPKRGQSIVICRVLDASCRTLTHGSQPKWSVGDGRIYFLRQTPTGVHDLWSIAVDGTDERRVAELGTFRSTDVFFDVSRQGLLTFAPFRAGRQEIWTASIK
jgi:serine/threonine protein kinase/Tol biopolymer transport system component